ncbi:MAG TPA: cytochrome c [Candidatus Methylomirabilis sp.]|nr:cytochrome c [Candidatus Methylomirabilis sp.]
MTNASRMARSVRTAALLAFASCGLLIGGCRQDMGDQPKNKPLSPSSFFGDARSERPLIENTVARGSIEDDYLYVPKDSNTFPLPMTPELMNRGQERYKIFCTPCHGLQGDGNGMIVMRGMKHPPTYHQDRLRQVPNGYLFDVITNGFGAMQGYSAQITPRDRWAIVAYVRALQLSRYAPVSELPQDLRDKLNAGGSPK